MGDVTMTDIIEARPVMCATCHTPARLQSDNSPFGLDGEQWYECADGHETKRSNESSAIRKH